MAKRKASLTSLSSDPETIEVLHSKLAKAEGKKASALKKAAKKPKTCVTKPKSLSGKRTKQVADDGKSDEENIDPSGGKQTILVNWSDKSLYYLTDHLFLLIEDSETWSCRSSQGSPKDMHRRSLVLNTSIHGEPSIAVPHESLEECMAQRQVIIREVIQVIVIIPIHVQLRV
ncbi:hypothetical protein L208DRAFT_1404944 [Tricholoma matsutake]|nr:hypothetical protein L208DRAFT_1404944 [Tricholoma matsutake 945]